MINFGNLAKEVFTILRSFDYDVMMYDDEGNSVIEPEDARRFFSKADDLMIDLVEDGENSALHLIHSARIQINEILGFLNTLRATCNKFSILINDRKSGEKITPATYVKESRAAMGLSESMYGTSKSSYLKLENARLVVKHSTRVDEKSKGARSRRIDRIYVENPSGERFLMPTKALLPGRAMAQHINKGGHYSDEIGEGINRMAREYADLGSCIRHGRKHAQDLPEGVETIIGDVRNCRSGMRKLFERLYRSYDKAHHEVNQESLTEEEATISDRIDELKNCLTCEHVELDEGIIETVARVTCRRARALAKADMENNVTEAVDNDDIKNSLIREHLNWFNDFTVERILLEDDDGSDEDDDASDGDMATDGASDASDDADEGDETVAEGEELSREDMIMPDNSSPDLKREVIRKKGPRAVPNLLMDDELDRVRKLAGLQK